MCGITGILNFSDKQVHSFEIKKMTNEIIHRGPDDEGIYVNKNIGLGFRRLSIIDLESGHQPLSNEDKSIWIVFNGEIYNYKELRADLKKQGHIFSTSTDTEVIIHLYEQYGKECVQYLRGMFSFSIWDNNKKLLFCARDRFGIKPFYYYLDSEKFVFGSELKAIIKSENVDKTISQDAIESYFAYGYITSNLSIYQYIKKLQPGHSISVSFKNKPVITICNYWDIKFEPDYSKSEKDWEEEIKASLEESTKLHMHSDVPLGAFLSGGVDSSIIVSLMSKNCQRPIKTFSIGFKEEKYSELNYAREVAQKYGCEHYEYIVEPESINLLPKLVYAYDEPFADISAIPTYYVSKFAREHVTVALSGDGGDELFAGYNIYNYLNKIQKKNFSNPMINKIIWGSIHNVIPQKFAGKGLSYFLSKDPKYIGAYLSIWTKRERDNLIQRNNNKKEIFYPEIFKKDLLKLNERDFISNLQYLDMRTYMVDDILTKVDRASMINSLEVRVPILDHKFAELTFKIPSEYKMNVNGQKYILKKAFQSHLTENVIKHPKTGFNLPISVWFKEELREYINDTLLVVNSPLYDYLNKKYIKKIVSNNLTGMRDFSGKIWSLIFFEEWLKQNKNENIVFH